MIDLLLTKWVSGVKAKRCFVAMSRKLHKQYQDKNRNNNYEVIYNCEIVIIGMELLYHIYTRSKFMHDV